MDKNFDQVLQESLGTDIAKGVVTAALVLLSSFGIKKQKENVNIAKEFLNQHPTYVEKLVQLKDIDRLDKITRNKVINQWKGFIDSQNLDPALSKGLKITGTGQLSTYNSGDIR